MKKRTIGLLLILVVIAISIAGIMAMRLRVPSYPEGTLSNRVIFGIRPQTILQSLDEDKRDVFAPVGAEPEDGWPRLWSPGAFAWGQADYIRIADALHEFVWGESLERWELIRAAFHIDQCQEVADHIDAVEFSFFRRLDGRIEAHGMWIHPLSGIVHAGDEIINNENGNSEWVSLNEQDATVASAETALLLAEEKGGESIRIENNHRCRIDLLLAPDKFEHEFLSSPFSRFGWGWGVIYWPAEANKDSLFEIRIDPISGRSVILAGQK